jgi:hypothetical protein
MKVFFVLFFFIFFACDSASPALTGKPQEVSANTPSNTESKKIRINNINFCSVEILWNYTDQTVTFTNKNDQAVSVAVYRTTDYTVIVKNYLLAKGEDSEDAHFSEGDEIEIVIEFLNVNLSLDQWKICARKTFILGRE